jgi:hypothetical protein
MASSLFNVRNYNSITLGRLAVDRGNIDQIPLSPQPKPPYPLRRLGLKLGISRPPFA